MIASRNELAQMKTFACRACGIAHPEERWATLALKECIAPSEVGRLLRGWPNDVCIEVRLCDRCEGMIAAKRPWRDSQAP
jgi:hypothetical protein